MWIFLWCNNFLSCVFLSDPVYSCLILSDPVCSLLLDFLSEIRISLWWNNYITYIILSIPVCSCLILSVTRYLNLFLLLKFLHEIWIYIWKKCRKYIKNKERKKEKDERWKRGMEKIKVDTWLTLLYLFHFAFMSPLFLLYAFIFSLDLLYFWSRSCNGFTPLCFYVQCCKNMPKVTNCPCLSYNYKGYIRYQNYF